MLLVLPLALGAVCAPVEPVPSAASYRRYKLFELVCAADLVVSGTIEAVNEPGEAIRGKDKPPPPTFLFDVDTTIVGAPGSDPIEVRCFVDWTCAWRWAPYQKGQREVLFLRAPAKDSLVWSIVGAGDEGEMPLEGSDVLLYGVPVRGHLQPGPPREEAPVRGSRVPITDLTTAVQGFRAQFTWVFEPKVRMPAEVRPRRDLAGAKEFAQSSAIARQMFEDARSAGSWRGPEEPLPELVFPAAVRTRESSELHFGGPVCVLGDVDGDGVADLASGEPYDSTIINQHGALHILFMAKDGTVARSHLVNEAVGTYPSTMNAFAHLGESVAPVGDVDGDGVPDLVVSAPGLAGNDQGRGSVWILLLRRDGGTKQAIQLDGDDKLRDAGVKLGSGLGASIANLGDLDGDGFPEIAIGQDPDLSLSEKEGGGLFIVSLGVHGVVRWVKRIHDHEGGFAEGYSWFGRELAALGDVNGDGIPDLAVSNSYDADGGKLRGAVWIVFLERDGTPKGKHKISDWSGDFEGRLHDDSSFGRQLFSLGDVDGDGVPDLAAGTWDALWLLLLNRDGSVRESKAFPMDRRTDVEDRPTYKSIVRMSSSEPRYLLSAFRKSGPNCQLQWFLRFGAKGELQSW